MLQIDGCLRIQVSRSVIKTSQMNEGWAVLASGSILANFFVWTINYNQSTANLVELSVVV